MAYLTSDIIVAQATPSGSGALALIRFSGQGVSTFIDTFARLSSHQKLQSQSSHTIHHGTIVNPCKGEQLIDEVLFFLMHAPRTFTGEDTIEISCHNNELIIQGIIGVAISHGARLAGPGEFSRRAVLNGKMDLVSAEAIHDVIGAQTQEALKKSLAAISGSFSSYLSELESQMVILLSFVEASFEFLDEEQRDLDLHGDVTGRVCELKERIERLLQSYDVQRQIKEGVRIALLGSVNAGKSTLFNALLGRDRAIVTSMAGTTRDAIEGTMIHEGRALRLIDTAGVREALDVIEQIGIKRSFFEAAQADLVLLVVDGTCKISTEAWQVYENLIEQYPKKVLLVLNKCDVIGASPAELPTTLSVHRVSAKTEEGLRELKVQISLKVQSVLNSHQAPFLLSKRHYSILQALLEKLKTIEDLPHNTLDYELIAYHLRDMLEQLAQLTGKNINEKMLDTVFGDFCIGK